VQLPFKDRDLVSEGWDLGVLVPIAHREQSEHRERIGHAEVRQSQQHGTASSPSDRYSDPMRAGDADLSKIRCGDRSYRELDG